MTSQYLENFHDNSQLRKILDGFELRNILSCLDLEIFWNFRI